MGAIDYTIHRGCRTVHFRGHGEISYARLMESVARLHQEPDFDFGFNSFIDFEEALVAPSDPGQRDYISWFSRLQKSTQPRRWAIYTLNPATIASANLTHMLVSRGIEIEVFSRIEDALDYLGVSGPELQIPAARLTSPGDQDR